MCAKKQKGNNKKMLIFIRIFQTDFHRSLQIPL